MRLALAFAWDAASRLCSASRWAALRAAFATFLFSSAAALAAFAFSLLPSAVWRSACASNFACSASAARFDALFAAWRALATRLLLLLRASFALDLAFSATSCALATCAFSSSSFAWRFARSALVWFVFLLSAFSIRATFARCFAKLACAFVSCFCAVAVATSAFDAAFLATLTSLFARVRSVSILSCEARVKAATRLVALFLAAVICTYAFCWMFSFCSWAASNSSLSLLFSPMFATAIFSIIRFICLFFSAISFLNCLFFAAITLFEVSLYVFSSFWILFFAALDLVSLFL